MANAKKKLNKKARSHPKPKSVVTPGTKKTAVAGPLEVAVYSMAGKNVGTIELPEKIFSAPWRPDLVHQVTTAMQANLRQNRASTKDRSEVAGGGKKPWKQKGTGQARHGSTRSPIWRHGGVTFGPRTARDYSEKISKSMRNQALVSVLSQKAKDGELILVDSFSFEVPKTALAKKALRDIAKATNPSLATKRANAALIAFSTHNANSVKSFRNIGSVATEEVRNLNPVEILTHRYLIIESPEASFKILSARLKK